MRELGFENFNNFLDWVNNQPHEEGFRNDTVVKIATEGYGRGFSKEFLKVAIEEYCQKSSLSLDEAIRIIERYEKKHAINPFEANTQKKTTKEIDWIKVTKDFLKTFFYQSGKWKLFLWNEDYYQYEDGRYHKMSEAELKGKISQYIMLKGYEFVGVKTSLLQQEIVNTLFGLILIPKYLDPPFYDQTLGIGRLNSSGQQKRNFISCANGVLDIDCFLKGESNVLMPHSSSYFCLTKLPYAYLPEMECPKWKNFLKTTFDEDEVIDLFQEWFGYNLIGHTDYQKFLLAVGQGSNGKSVVLKVLSLMLGDGNYVSIGLENFDPKRTFPLANLNGMMANIVNDLNEIHKTGEGLLKQFVSGEPITVERKYKDPFTMKTSAKLTMATNVKPHFMDRSDGLWRRLIMVTFKKQILDESKQDKNLMNDKWWLESGELPGVLNWSLEGLKRLEERGSFIIPKSVQEDCQRYRLESNAAATFILTNLREDPKGEEFSHWIYRDYQQFCQRNGYRALSAHNFAAELRRVYPSVSLSNDSKITSDPFENEKASVRSRSWIGLSYASAIERIPTPYF